MVFGAWGFRHFKALGSFESRHYMSGSAESNRSIRGSEYRGLNNYHTILGVPYYKYSIGSTETLFFLLGPYILV